jgi:hypothetical protein
MYNNLTEFGIPLKLLRLITICLNVTYRRVWVGKNLSDIFPIKNSLKQGDASSSSLPSTLLEVQVNQDDLK